MKRIMFTAFICCYAIVGTSCEELASLIESSAGCMLEDAPNYDSAALLPCSSECLNDQTGNNCCCEEIVYGCMDNTAPNYSETANSPCVEEVSGVETPNACCSENIPGCMDQGASNYDSQATVEDNDQCTYDTAVVEVTDEDGTTTTVTVTYGCMNSDACNYIEPSDSTATYGDCNAENADIVSEWVQNDDCCDLTKNSACYLDLNYNGYYEEVNATVSTCNCGELGVGWVSADEVACSDDNNDGICDDVEIQGCTSVVNTGFTELVPTGTPCAEYDPSANVDNGGCCLIEFSFDDFENFDESSLDFMGVFNVDFTYGMLNDAGECAADTMMDMGGPDVAQITLGPPDASGIGQMQYFEEFQDVFDSHPEWDFQVADAGTEEECYEAAEENDSWYYNCVNQGYNQENCEDFQQQEYCPMDHCFWETNFCHPTFQGMPCHEIVVISGDVTTAEMECENNGCEWNESNTCVQPSHIPGEQCWGMNEYDCGFDPECMTNAEFENYDPETNDDGPPDCMLDDDPACYFPEGLDDYDGVQMCDWLTTEIWPSTGPDACIIDCEDELVYGNPNDPTLVTGHMGQQIEHRVHQCEDCLSENANNPNDNGAMCDNLWGEDGGGGNGPEGPNCSAWMDEGTPCTDVTIKDACFCDNDCMWQGDENGICIDDVCGAVGNIDNCLDGSVNPGCDWVYPGHPEFNCLDPIGCCVTIHDEGPGCLEDCAGISTLQQNSSSEEICTFITNLWNDPLSEWLPDNGPQDACFEDCDYYDYWITNYNCIICLADSDDNCDWVFGGYGGDGNNYNPDIVISDLIFSQINKANSKPVPGSSLSRSNDHCSTYSDPNEPNTTWIDDCSGDGDCCPEYWIADGYADCQDQAYGCDLSCYNNDGGDCGEGFVLECVPNNPCYYIDEPNDCAWQGCDWDDSWSECHPKPVMTDVHNQCGMFVEQDCTSENTDGLCEWEDIMPDNFQGEWVAHCAPTSSAQGDDCFSLNSRFDCDNSDNCNWDAPDFMEEWQTGACFSHNPCVTPENNNPETCDNNNNCEWDWAQNLCIEAGSNNNFCDCWISHTERSCNEIFASWQLPDWSADCEDCGEIEFECWVPMEDQDCFHEYDDPCAQFYGGSNEHTEWDEATHTCTKSFSFTDAGQWGLGVDCLELNWSEQPEPDCTEDPLQSEETCYCFDCQWDSGSCADWTDDGMGRTTDQAKMHNFQEMIYELSGSSGNGECIEYNIMDGGVIHLLKTDPEYGYCQIIMLTPAATGSDS